MTRHDTTLSYATRIERVLEHIADHLDDVLDLEALADIACFSPWHFHRVFVAVTGETAQEAVRRLRLHRAAVELGRSDRAPAQIARRAGYGSVVAFSRAFAAAYGLPPAAWRKRAHDLRSGFLPQTEGRAMTSPAASRHAAVAYDVSIATLAPIHLVCLPHRGDYQAIGTTFDRLLAWAGPRGLIGAHCRMIGIYFDDPASTGPSELRSEACITALDDVEPGPGMHRHVIPAGRVARLVHKGPYADLDVAYAHLYRTWLPTSGEEPGSHPVFEEYLNNPRQNPPQEWLTAVHLPLKE